MNSQKINAAINAILPCFDGMDSYDFYRFKNTDLREYMQWAFPLEEAMDWLPIQDFYSPHDNVIRLEVCGWPLIATWQINYSANKEQHIVFDIAEVAKRIAEEKLNLIIEDNPNWAPNSALSRFLPVEIHNFGV
jgi:hypothetical protein